MLKPRFKYRMRAECAFDVLRSFAAFTPSSLTITECYLDPANPQSWIPDVDVVFVTHNSLEQVKSFFREAPDGHVMLETVALAEEYTGEREP